MADLSRIEKHITLVGVFHIVYHALALLFGLLIVGILGFVGTLVYDPVGTRVLWLVGTFVATFLIVLSVPGIIGGIWLLKRREWARILTLIVGALGLIDIPLGTALGVYTLWALIQDEAVEACRRRPGD
jgi:hypothetical protein